MPTPKKRPKAETATVYVIQKRDSRNHRRFVGLFGAGFTSLSNARVFPGRPRPLNPNEEAVPARLTLLSAKSKRSKKRTR